MTYSVSLSLSQTFHSEFLGFCRFLHLELTHNAFEYDYQKLNTIHNADFLHK